MLVTVSGGLARYGKKIWEVASVKFGLGSYGGTRTGNAEITTTDERSRDGENLLGKQGNVEGLGDGGGTREHVQDRLVARLDGQDGCGSREDGRVPHEMRSTRIRADSDVLDKTRDGYHGRDVSEHAGEVELALQGSRTERGE